VVWVGLGWRLKTLLDRRQAFYTSQLYAAPVNSETKNIIENVQRQIRRQGTISRRSKLTSPVGTR
jgi:hypothetical protein